MTNLPMPSDVKAAQALNPGALQSIDAPIEPPSVKLIVRLFLIPLLIVAAAVGIMFLIGRLAGDTPTFDEALARLKNPGGDRTANYLIGPGSKQRYMDAKTLVDRMKSGMSDAERMKISRELVDILGNHTNDNEGDVRHFLLLALGRVWQIDPSHLVTDSPEAVAARADALGTLMRFAQSDQVANRKAAILALVYWAGRDELKQAVPLLLTKLQDNNEDLDVRLAAATVLGPISRPEDKLVIDALNKAMLDTEPAHKELVWAAALSLAQLNQANVADTVLMLLNRDELSKLDVLDRESDPKNPVFRRLSDAEQQRILINTMIGAKKLNVPGVQQRLTWIANNDPSPRVRDAAREVLQPRS